MLEHGGRLRRAAAAYGIPLADWLDLSTGINPDGWPTPSIPAEAWQRLPEDDDGLSEAACAYYGARHALAVAGSQAAIQALPRLYRQLHGPCRVGVAAPGYAEHAHAWGTAGHEVVAIPDAPVGCGYRRVYAGTWPPSFGGLVLRLGALSGASSEARTASVNVMRIASLSTSYELPDDLDVLLLIHPNNPSGQRYELETLLAWHERLAARGGWLVVDEAFMDCTPEFSLAAHAHLPGLIVLRSLGKFFGLAGARVGFVLAEAALLERLRDLLGPWALNGPARHIATLALRDTAWQDAARTYLLAATTRLADLLTRHGLPPDGGSALFQWITNGPGFEATPENETGRPCSAGLFHVEAEAIHVALAHRGILTRLFADPASLRFGLPGGEAGWNRLGTAMREVMA